MLKEQWVTKEQYEEHKLDIISRACVNYVKAGECTVDESFTLRDRMMQLPIQEVLTMLLESNTLAEEQGLPLAYRFAGITN